MNLSQKELKQIIIEELSILIAEGKVYMNFGDPGTSIAIFHEDQDGTKDYDWARQRFGKTGQIVKSFSKNPAKLTLHRDAMAFFAKKGYKFQPDGGIDKVIPPNEDKAYDFVFVAQLKGKDKEKYAGNPELHNTNFLPATA